MNFSNIILSGICLLVFSSCNKRILELKKSGINTTYNKTYKESIKTFEGQLTQQAYIQVRTQIEDALGVVVAEDKPILINYFQKAPNCRLMTSEDKYIRRIIQNGISISERVSSTYNTVDFFVYTDDAYVKEYASEFESYQEDPGFFNSVIFTLDENCSGFFIIKPDGKFLKYYGFDYFTIVENYLKL